MDRRYSDYIDIINEVENIERVVITNNRFKKKSYFILELIKFVIQYIKNININIDGGKKRQNQLFLQLMKKLLKKHQLLSLLVQCVKRC